MGLLKFLIISVSLCCLKDSSNAEGLFSAEILKDKGHLGKIVALQPLASTEVESSIPNKTELSPTQVNINVLWW